jgi:hypothetical protein
MLRENSQKPASCEARDAIYGENNVQEAWMLGTGFGQTLGSINSVMEGAENEG